MQKHGGKHNYHSLYSSGLYICGGPVNSSGDLPQVSGYICTVQ